MNIRLILHTVAHLKIEQIVFQIRNRLHKPKFRAYGCPETCGTVRLACAPIAKSPCLCGGEFRFLNLPSEFNGWNDTRNGMLWAYNLNYMDYLLQPGMTAEEGGRWIDRWISDSPGNHVGLDPYASALRIINWIKFVAAHGDRIDEESLKKWNDSLYSQYRLLKRKTERHLLGNHLLEDAYALFFGAVYFGDRQMYGKARKLLPEQLEEQTLPDGAHYEQSPMYHCILLDRLLDCINISASNARFDGQSADTERLKHFAARMLGHLESIIWDDGSIPLLNDSARGIAPEPRQLFDYARRLGLEWKPIPLGACGYRRLRANKMEAIADAGGIAAAYIPGHSHADTFNYELRIGGQPFIVDTGISTYNKTPRRQYERSASAHNTVTVAGRDSSEVWGGFRVGRRAKATILSDTPNLLTAEHDGFRSLGKHRRDFRVTDAGLEIADSVTKPFPSQSYLHFAPGVEIESWTDREIVTADGRRIEIEGAEKVSVTDGAVSTEYNRLLPVKIAVIEFTNFSRYTIKI